MMDLLYTIRIRKLLSLTKDLVRHITPLFLKKNGCKSKYYLFERKAFRTPNEGVPKEINIVPKLYYSQHEIDELGNVTVIEEDILYFVPLFIQV